jgi:hypothetical protein
MTEVYVTWRVTPLYASLCRGMGKAMPRLALIGLVLITGAVGHLTYEQLLYPTVPVVARGVACYACLP